MAEAQPGTMKVGDTLYLAFKDGRVSNEHDYYCARCVEPGHCCKSLPLNIRFPLGSTADEVQKHVTDGGLPFVPIEVAEKLVVFETWRFNCTALGENGRCTIYNRRPLACKTYDPGTDELCVHHRVDGRPVVPLASKYRPWRQHAPSRMYSVGRRRPREERVWTEYVYRVMLGMKKDRKHRGVHRRGTSDLPY